VRAPEKVKESSTKEKFTWVGGQRGTSKVEKWAKGGSKKEWRKKVKTGKIKKKNSSTIETPDKTKERQITRCHD